MNEITLPGVTSATLTTTLAAKVTALTDTRGVPADIGCVGNGVADDSTALQARIARAIVIAATAGGAILEIPAGTYKLGTELSTAGMTNITVRGAGIGRTILKPTGEANCFKGANVVGSVLTNCTFSDFEIDGSGQTLPVGGYNSSKTKGLYISYLRGCTFRDLYIHDTGATGLGVDFLADCVIENVRATGCGRLNDGTQPGGSGIGIGTGKLDSTGEALTVVGCRMRNNKRYGLFFEVQSGGTVALGISVFGCYASGNQYGFGDAGGLGVQFVACHAFDNSGAGFVVDLGTLGTGIGVETTYHSCVADQNGVSAATVAPGFLIVTNQGGFAVDGIQLVGCRSFSNTGSGVLGSFHFQTSTIRRIGMSDCYFHDNGESGVDLIYTGGTGPTVAYLFFHHNRVYNNGKSAHTSKDGLRMSVLTEKAEINHNLFWDDAGTPKQDTGIKLVSGFTMTNAQIYMNKAFNHLTANFSFAGTVTTCKIRWNNGYTTEARGTATIASGQTTVAVTHGLAQAPLAQEIALVPTNNKGSATEYWISAVSSSTFTISVDADPGATTATFGWKAELG